MLKPSLVTLTATIFNESAFRDIWAVTGGSTDSYSWATGGILANVFFRKLCKKRWHTSRCYCASVRPTYELCNRNVISFSTLSLKNKDKIM